MTPIQKDKMQGSRSTSLRAGFSEVPCDQATRLTNALAEDPGDFGGLNMR